MIADKIKEPILEGLGVQAMYSHASNTEVVMCIPVSLFCNSITLASVLWY